MMKSAASELKIENLPKIEKFQVHSFKHSVSLNDVMDKMHELHAIEKTIRIVPTGYGGFEVDYKRLETDDEHKTRFDDIITSIKVNEEKIRELLQKFESE